MKYFILFALLIGINNNVFCQKDSLRLNSVFIELSDFIPLSINYDRKIPFNNKIGLNIGCGFTLNTDIETDASSRRSYRYVCSYIFPIQIKSYYQFKKHTFDFGGTFIPYIGRAFIFTPFVEKGILIYGGIGYKYSIFNKKCYIGVSFYPIYWNSYNNKFFLFRLGDALRFGYKF